MMVRGTQTDEDRAINLLVPMWLKAIGGIICVLLASAIIGAAGWARNMERQVNDMTAELKALNAITAERFAALKERLDRERREDDRRRTEH